VDLARLDDEDVACARLEFASIHVPEPSSFSDELDLVVRVPMRSRSPARLGVEEEYRNVHVAVIGADELVGAADEREILLADTVHGGRSSWLRSRV
jgi:hypothetical protein